jgi:hypothetical protein
MSMFKVQFTTGVQFTLPIPIPMPHRKQRA